MKKLIIVLFAAVLVMFLGCNKSSDSPTSPSTTNATLVNSWKLTLENGAAPSWTEILVLNADNSFSVSGTFSNGSSCTLTGTYTVSGNNITSTTTATTNSSLCPIVNPTSSYTYSISGNNLTFTSTSNNNVSVYQKQ